MGRKKKVQIEVSTEGLEYIKALIKEYPEMKQFCDEMEKQRPMLLKRGGINPAVFSMDAPPSKQQFTDPVEAGSSYSVLMEYLNKKERVYLLEHGIYSLTGLPHDVARALFLDRMSWEEVISSLNVSRMTVDRARNEAIRFIAAEAEDYMFWKAQNMFI